MTITNGLATLAEFKAFATVRGGTSTTDAGDDTVIEDIIEQVSRHIEGQTGRRFWKNSSDETRYFQAVDSEYCDVSDLSATPTSVSVDYSGIRSYTAIDADDYELDPPNAALDGQPYTRISLIPTSDEYFPLSRRGVKVVGKFGFPSVPDDIKNLCLAIGLNVYQNRSGQSSAGNATITAAGIVIRPQDVPSWGQQIITHYRRYL
jgi:hypothetical protein